MDLIHYITPSNTIALVAGLILYSHICSLLGRRRSDVHRLRKPVRHVADLMDDVDFTLTCISSGERTLALGTREACLGELRVTI